MLRFAFCLIVAASAAFSVAAEPAGIWFDQMPVGCKIHGRYSSGKRVVDVYVGKSGKHHIIKTYEGPEGRRLIRTSTFSRDGLLLRKDWADGNWETFSPASCLPVPGACRYTYRNIDGAKLEYRGKNTVDGRTVISNGGFVGEAPFAPIVSVRGRFNDQESFVEGDTSFKVTKYEDCDTPRS
jgi:hypothetical protein